MNLLNINKIEPEKKTFYYTLARNTALVSGIFSFIVCILIIINFIQIKTQDPFNSTELKSLITRVQSEPENQSLKDTIRSLDLLARKAYFSSLVSSSRGAGLLLAGVVIFLISMKVISELKQKLPQPGKAEQEEEITEAGLTARWSVAGLGAALVLVSLILPFFLQNNKTNAGKIKSGAADTVPVTGRESWPCFRGPGGLGISKSKNIPIKWDGETGKGVLWKTPIPRPGKNSPIIGAGRIFISGADAGIREIYCFNEETGEMLWQKNIKTDSPAKPLETTKDTGYAAPTMTMDNERVFAVFANGLLACLDLNGSQIWTRELGVPDNHYGHASSLIMAMNLLFVQFDHNAGAKIIAVQPDTGKTVWEQKRPVNASWASPIVVNTGKQMELILNASPFLISYAPETGRELWRLDCMEKEEVGASPAYADGLVFAANEYARLAAVKQGKIIWENSDDLPEASSPLAVKGLLFVATSGGVVTCFEQKTGKVLWKHEFPEGFYSSPVFAEDKVYLMDNEGVSHIFNAENKFKLINSSPLGEPAATTPAFTDGRIYIRSDFFLYCIGSK